MIKKVISGGQCGADQIGLEVATTLGIPTGGWAPHGWRTEEGPAPWLAEYGLYEHPQRDYVNRTRENVHDADATLLFGDMSSAGSAMTIRACKEFCRPYLTNPTASEIRALIKKYGVEVVNIAGNRASKLPEDAAHTMREVLFDALYEDAR
jgi:hypothetical protein